jgi:cobalt-zinc-cadmium efflux system membrane fusion protein
VVSIEEKSQTVVLSAEQVSAIKIKSGKMEQRSIKNVIKANGYLDVPPQNKAVVSPMITGYVRKINFLVGDNVRKGQVMAELQSLEFIEMQQEFATLNAQIEFLKDDFERQKILRDQDAVSRKKYMTAEADYKTTASALKGLRAKLELLGVDFEKIELGYMASSILLRAPISGSVKKLNTVIGKHVDPSEELFEIVDPEHLHLELSVFEKDVSRVKKGQSIWFVVPSLSRQVFEGEIFLVGKDMAENKRSINVHVHINEDEADFEVGMYANASIVIEDNSTYTLPVTAVVMDGNTEYIFRQTRLDDQKFSYEKIAVLTGNESDGIVEITDFTDLKPEDEIVSEGAFYLLNAFSD